MSYQINDNNRTDQTGFHNWIYAKTENWSLWFETPIPQEFAYEDNIGIQEQVKNYLVAGIDIPMDVSYNNKMTRVSTIINQINPFSFEYESPYSRHLFFKDIYSEIKRVYSSKNGLLLGLSDKVSLELKDRREADRYDEFVNALSVEFSITATKVSSGFHIENDFYTAPITTDISTTTNT
ncbi:MAG: hypothetical protein ACXAB7_05970 [Candidatus Kariarchaeaceae archaeon]|jgi:hypothetical protein